MAQIDCPVTNEQCEYCTNKATNPRSINVVTVSLAVKHSLIPTQVIKQYGSIIQEKPPEHGEYPGTELRKLISWFVWDKKVKNCSICRNREDRMNRWGADKCQENIATIIIWLQESAQERGYPFSSRIANVLIRKAIANSRK